MGWAGNLASGVVGKVVAGVMGLAVVVAGISWWQMDPATRAAIIDSVGKVLGWTISVVALPWVSFLIIGWVGKMQSNAAGAVLVLTLTLLEAVALYWLFDWHLPGSTAWSLSIAGVLVAGVYNLLACDWIAEKLE